MCDFMDANQKMDINNQIEIGAKLIKEGKVVAFPTETVYGLGANALNPEAVAKIYELKERPSFDPLIVHIADISDIENIAIINDNRVYDIAKKFWPGPLTIILPKKNVIPDIVTSGLPTVGVRIPNNTIALELIKKSGCPIAAPSANKFGKISPTRASHVKKYIPNIDFVIDGGKTTVGIESTIIRINDDGFEILRYGVITENDLSQILPKSSIKTENKILASGMMKSHYSPDKKFYLLTEDLLSKIDKSKAGLISFSGKYTNGFKKVIQCSNNNNLAEYAINIFDAMHQMEESDVEIILAEPVEEKGIGKAIMDRLKKAAYRHK